MMEWTKFKLKDLVELKQGFALNKKSDHYLSHNNSGIPLLKISDLINGIETLFVKESIPRQFLVYPHEIIYSRTGQVGLAFMGKTGVVYNNCFKVIPGEKVHSVYLFHWLNQPAVRDEIRSLATGAAQPDLNHDAFKSVKINLPPLPTQKRIASILSAYDDLIENNSKRIKLLEEIAQRTYEEWFVKFRVNGEQLPMDEETGLPVGWERKKLSEIADIKWGDTSVTKSSYCEKGFLAYSASGPDGLLDYFDYDKSGVVLSAIGAYAGLTWLALGKWSAIKNTMVFWSKQKALSNHYLFLATRGINYWNRRGAAQPFIAQGDAKLQQIVLPNEDINIQFSKNVEPIYEVIYKLNATNKLLKQSRDILLPRLMSGTINVES